MSNGQVDINEDGLIDLLKKNKLRYLLAVIRLIYEIAISFIFRLMFQPMKTQIAILTQLSPLFI